jgi:hypothetical protein
MIASKGVVRIRDANFGGWLGSVLSDNDELFVTVSQERVETGTLEAAEMLKIIYN